MMRSAVRSVERRCAMRMVVSDREAVTLRTASLTSASEAPSRALVALCTSSGNLYHGGETDGALIKDENAGPTNECPRDGQTLSLTAR